MVEYIRKLFHKHKVMTTLLISYMVILIIPIIIGSIAYYKATDMIENEVSNSKMLMLKQACNSVDSRLNEIQQMAVNVSLNYSIRDFLNINSPLNENDRYKATHVIRDIQAYKNSNYFIQDFYIYYKNSDAIITPDSMYSSEFYYKNLYTYNDIDYKEWIDSLNKPYYNYYKASQNITVGGQWPSRMISYIQSVPIYERTNPEGTLVILIPEIRIKQLLNEVSEQGVSYIQDKDNNIFATTGNIADISVIEPSSLKNDSGVFYHNKNKNDMVVLYTTSPRTEWKYISIVPKAIFKAKANYILKMTIIIVGICLILGLLVAYIFAYKNYSPILKIINTLSTLIGAKSLDIENEYDYINNTIVTAMSKNKQLEESQRELEKLNREYCDRINKNGPMLKNSLILKIVEGYITDPNEIMDWPKLYDISFPFNFFVVLLFHIDENRLKVNNINILATIRYNITSLDQKFGNENCKSYFCDIDNETLAFLINLSCENDIIQIKDGIYAACEKLKAVLEKQTSITVGIGGINEGFKNIRKSYNEAMMALDYKMIKGCDSIIYYDQIVEKDKDYYYPLKCELQIINSIKTGDIKNCNELLHYIFNENFNNRKLPIKLIKCLFFDIMSTIIKLLNEISIKYIDIFEEGSEPINKLIKCETVKEMEQEIEIVCIQICNFINSHKVSGNEKIKKLILQYIDQNFYSSEMSQSFIAQRFGITAPYLSKIFKQETGQCMVDYINKLKINKAKYLIKNTQLTLLQIAEQVGCCNDKTLIRIFKQYEGVTPGKYKDGLLIEHSSI